MKTLGLLIGLLWLSYHLSAQAVRPVEYGLKEFTIQDKQLGRIDFYVDTTNLHQKGPLFIETNGSGGLPLCLYLAGHRFVTTSTTFGGDTYEKTRRKYHYVILGKPGTRFCDTLKAPNLTVEQYQQNPAKILFSYRPSEEYTRRLSLEWRVRATKAVITYLNRKRFWDGSTIIAYGYSEGGQVVPALAVADKRITHVVPVVGSGLNQFYDNIINWRIKGAKGELTYAQVQDSINAEFKRYADIYQHPTATDKEFGGHSYQRWASFGTTIPFEELRKLNIPIYMIVATADSNSPIYGLDYVPLDFLRLGKKNLTYDTCVGCNHYLISQEQGQAVHHSYMDKLLTWAERHH